MHERVKGPATGLIVAAILGAVVNVLSLLNNLLDLGWYGGMEGADASFMAMGKGLSVVSFLFGMALCAVVFLGAQKMKRLESYPMALTAAILGIIPCGTCCLVGLPVGIWALIVLTKAEVKQAFTA